MVHGTRTVYFGKRNKGLSSTFQPPAEGHSIQQRKRYDKHGDENEDNCPKNVNNNCIGAVDKRASYVSLTNFAHIVFKRHPY